MYTFMDRLKGKHSDRYVGRWKKERYIDRQTDKYMYITVDRLIDR